MKIGVPKEIKPQEQRVGCTPAGVKAFTEQGHTVLVEAGAGEGSGFADAEYQAAGAVVVKTADEAWGEADMVLKVKEPIEPEFARIVPGQILFTYLHLAADRTLTEKLIRSGAVGIAYETVQLSDGSLPLLAPMSEVAGALSVQMGAWCLEKKNGGMGVLLSGVPGVRPARVTVIGGGTAGFAAASLAAGMGAQVTILDINTARLTYLRDVTGGRVLTLYSNSANLEQICMESDLVIGSVLLPGAKAPKLVTRGLLREMKDGSAFVDISVDQGGCAETTRPTTHADPIFVEEGVVHYCVANMPGAVPRTSTLALTNATHRYAMAIADKGWELALDQDPALAKGLNVFRGAVACGPVAEAFDLPCAERRCAA